MSDIVTNYRPEEGTADDERDATWSRKDDEHEFAEYDADSVESCEDVVCDDKFGAGAPSLTTEEKLQQVQRELCLIRLHWPEVAPTKDPYALSLPDTYRCVSDKERLLLCYAENFRRQFHARHPNRRPLLLACDNECGVQVSKVSEILFRHLVVQSSPRLFGRV